MELLEMMQARRSVRRYTGERIPDEKIERILQAGLLAPTSRNRKPYELILVTAKNTITALSESRPHGSQILAGADAAIVVVADTGRSDVWVEDCSIVMGYMHLMADALGVGSCWVQSRKRENQSGGTADEYIRELLGIPEGYSVEATLCLGMPAEKPTHTELSELRYDKVHREKF